MSEYRWKGKRIGVIGLGVSNMALIRYLTAKGASIIAMDKKTEDQLGDTVRELTEQGVELRLGDTYLQGLDDCEELFVAPGVPKTLPELAAWQDSGRPLQSEMTLFFDLCPAPIVGITGSSGKTTTTTLIGEILSAAGFKIWVGGNIGTPLIEKVEELKDADWVILELSSFQLEIMNKSPQVAVITNITPNHLDVHPTMKDYVEAKKRIFRFQSGDDCLILNHDYPVTRRMSEEAPGQVLFFGRGDGLQTHAFLDNDRVVLHLPDGKREVICHREEIRLLGEHNLENVLAASAAAALCGAPDRAIRKVVTSFTGVSHRLEKVASVRGVAYYNDSIATTPSRAIAGITAFERPVILIAGGYDKKLPFTEFAMTVVQHCKCALLLGATADKIEDEIIAAEKRIGRQIPVRQVASLEEAVVVASRIAAPGDVVLLSPACASYDMFTSYIERGNRFRELVVSLAPAENVSASRGDGHQREQYGY